MKRISIGWIALSAVALVTATATVTLADGPTAAAVTATPRRVLRAADETPFPSAAEFAHVFVDTTNRFAADHGDSRRIGRVHCVQAAPGRYMCSYASRQRGGARQCHLMQARWTPELTSTITVTLAGRTARCGSLRAAIDSLQ